MNRLFQQLAAAISRLKANLDEVRYDYRLLQEARKRQDDESVPVTIDELRSSIEKDG